VIGGSLAVGALAGNSVHASQARATSSQTRTIYRLSLRGRRGSRAAKRHNANLRFASAGAAALHRAHRGDHSRVVGLTVSAAVFEQLFPALNDEVADLRAIRLGCAGDCDRGGSVTVDELVNGVNIALGNAASDSCRIFDTNRNGSVTVDELVKAVNYALNGCPS
jgi:hypothetical protein